ncbi:hypothetical protein GCM10011399_34980 [Subtercola lobariae]|uniref:FAD-binding domain-containing protein n=1 Tax=Subtercola lobariae TaxID=1588641 RepID=A0A917F3C6_9MICO|nr:hypothetical protein GCM10011399_34980 [Subtercola lobariae]
MVEPRGAAVDKACGEGLMPGAVAELLRLGVRPHGHPLTGITYKSAAHPTWRQAGHDFRAGPGVGMRRTELSTLLTERAASCGVRFRLARVESLVQDARGVTLSLASGNGDLPSTLRSEWVFGCDGLHSSIRGMLELDPPPAPKRSRRRFGLRQHFAVTPWSDHVEVYWSPRFELYVTPVGERMIGVALLGERGLDLAAAIAATPELAARLDGADAMTPVRGAGPLRQRVAQHARGRVLLIGDASGYVDALTGEGLRLGFAQATAAVAALAAPIGLAAARVAPATASDAPATAPVAASVAPATASDAPATAPVAARVASAIASDAPATAPVAARDAPVAALAASTGQVASVPAAARGPAADLASAAEVVARYERGWLTVSGGPTRFTAALYALSRTPLRAAFVPAGSHVPAVFSAAVERLAE